MSCPVGFPGGSSSLGNLPGLPETTLADLQRKEASKAEKAKKKKETKAERKRAKEEQSLTCSDRSESELAINIKKATSIEETAPKRKHVRSCIVYTWDHKSSQSFWAGMKV
jgi:hypothetical protein